MKKINDLLLGLGFRVVAISMVVFYLGLNLADAQTNETESNNSVNDFGVLTIVESGAITGTVRNCGRCTPDQFDYWKIRDGISGVINITNNGDSEAGVSFTLLSYDDASRSGFESTVTLIGGAATSDAYVEHLELMHFAEGSAMTPILLNLYVGRLGEAGAPLHPRIQHQLDSHYGYMNGMLRESGHFVLDNLSAVDIMLSFPAEIAMLQKRAEDFPRLAAFVSRIHDRPAYQRAVALGHG